MKRKIFSTLFVLVLVLSFSLVTAVPAAAVPEGPNALSFTHIAASNYASLALRGDGTVWAWGCNNYGTLGDGTKTHRKTPVQVHGGETGDAYSAHRAVRHSTPQPIPFLRHYPRLSHRGLSEARSERYYSGSRPFAIGLCHSLYQIIGRCQYRARIRNALTVLQHFRLKS